MNRSVPSSTGTFKDGVIDDLSNSPFDQLVHSADEIRVDPSSELLDSALPASTIDRPAADKPSRKNQLDPFDTPNFHGLS